MIRELTIAILFISCSEAYYKHNKYYSVFRNECRGDKDCMGSKACIHGQCRKIKSNINCADGRSTCPKLFCCMLNYMGTGTCIKHAQNFSLKEGDTCTRKRNGQMCGHCACGAGLICAKDITLSHSYTCQKEEVAKVCSDDEHCGNDHCCANFKCKPKPKLGEKCYPRWDIESLLECYSKCEYGTECVREPKIWDPSWHECKMKKTRAITTCYP